VEVDESQALFAGVGANGGKPWGELMFVLESKWWIQELCPEMLH